jgi:signal transduction histidine kinase
VLRVARFGLIAATTFAPAHAWAFEAGAAAGGSLLALVLTALGLGLTVAALRRRVHRLEAETATLSKSLAEHGAILAAAPAALYRLGPDGDGALLNPGPLGGIAGATRLRGLAAALDGAARDALQGRLDALSQAGAGFTLAVRLAATGQNLDIVGSRVRDAAGEAADIVAVTDAQPRADAAAECDRVKELLDVLPRPMWRRRKSDLVLVACNRAYAEAVDGSVETAVAEGRELGAGVVPRGGRALAEAARRPGAAQEGRYHIVIGGSRRLVEITESPVGAEGDIAGFARDLTDLEAKEADLARHVAAHDEVLENIAVAIAIYGPDTRLTFFNTAFARFFMLEEDWLAAEPTMDEVLERLRERRRLPEHADFRFFKREQRAMFNSLLAPHEELMHLPDERTLRLVVSPHPMGGLIFAYEDVTDRLALERSYNTLIEVQRETLDHLYEALAVFGSDGRLKLWNPAYAKIWRLAPEDLAGEPHIAQIVEKTRDFYEADDWDGLKTRIIARITSEGAASTRLERSDGSVLLAVNLPLPDGNILLSYLDVTDTTRVEEALRERNEALETAGRLKSEFIANVSYELRTPLNAIIGFAEILTNQYFGPLNPRQIDYSRGILDSSNRLLSLINDILDLATIEAGYMQIEMLDVDIHALMSSVLTFTRERARNQGLKLEFDCDTTIGTILADERRLKQALFNLVSNALKFTPSGGTVTLAAYRAPGRVALVVADTGVGVRAEDKARIFEKFERGDPQARQSGPGLGLSLVKSFIELHGGTVELDSHPGSGTTVTCWLYDEALRLVRERPSSSNIGNAAPRSDAAEDEWRAQRAPPRRSPTG